MSEESVDDSLESEGDGTEEAVAKPRFKIGKPNPIIYFIAGPFVVVFFVYIVLTKILISSDLAHEAKLEEVMAISNIAGDEVSNSVSSESKGEDGQADLNQGGGSFLDTHNYFQFPVSFAVNIPDTNKNLTFDLAVSTFQSGVTAEWFFESFTAFVPAIRSDILYFMGAQSLKELQTPDNQAALLKRLREVINLKLESLGADPEISDVMFISFIVT